MKISANFTGFMDMDSDDRFIAEGNYRLLKNGIIDRDSGGSRFLPKNLRSSKLVCEIPADGKYLGGKEYKGFYYVFFIEDSDLSLYRVDLSTEEYQELFNEYLDDFPPSKEINYIDFVENQSTGDLLCYWTDGINPPFKVNITRLVGGFRYDSIYDMLNAKKVPPEPTIKMYRDFSKADNMRDIVFQFAQRYIYKDGEKTPLSTYSRSAFLPKDLALAPEVGSAKIGYFLGNLGGNTVLWRTSDFGASFAIISSSGHTDYDKVLCSKDGRIVILFSSTRELPVKRSMNYGQTFVEGDKHRFTDGCMSDDGRYVFFYRKKLWRSDDSGGTITLMQSDLDSEKIVLRCSKDGKYVLLITLSNVKSDSKRYMHLRVWRDQEEVNHIEEKLSDSATISGDISPSGRSVVVWFGDQLYTSHNYGKDFSTVTKGISGVKSLVIYDNGIGFGDGFRTTDFFQTETGYNNSSADEVWRFNNAVVLRSVDVNKKILFDGTLVASFLSISAPAFTDTVDVRDVFESIDNHVNVVDIYIKKPNKEVDKVEVLAIDVNTNTAYIIDSLSNDQIPSQGITVEFFNNSIYRALAPSEKNVLYSNIPETARHQAFIGNRLFYANYTEGKRPPSPDFAVKPNASDLMRATLSAEINPSATEFVLNTQHQSNLQSGDILVISLTYFDDELKFADFTCEFDEGASQLFMRSDDIKKEWKTLFPYGNVILLGQYRLRFITGDMGVTFKGITYAELYKSPLTYRGGHPLNVGIAYYDEYNRGSSPVFDKGRVETSYLSEKIVLRATINHKAPDWARSFKFVRADRDLEYFVILGFQYVTIKDGYVYLKKLDADHFLPEAGMYLETSSFSAQVINKVNKEADFVAGAPSGDWIVIKDPKIEGYSAADINGNAHKYYSSVFYARQPLEAKDNVLFYEIPGVYEIENGLHDGNVQNQTENEPAIIDIYNDGNVFYLKGFDAQTNQIGDNKIFLNGGRSLLEVENPLPIHRFNDWTWSDLFVQDSGLNGFSMFDLNKANFKSAEISNGAITGLLALGDSLYIWQEDQVGYSLINKHIITSARGETTIAQSDQVSSELIAYTGKWGTLDPLSIFSYGGIRYFVDSKRQAICRISQDGIVDISDLFMTSVFNNVINTSNKFKGVFNHDNKEAWFYSENNRTMYIYDTRQQGWTRIINPIWLDGIFNYGKNIYAIRNKRLFLHGAGEGYGKIHDEDEMEFELVYSVNRAPEAIKVFNAIELESNRPVKTTFSIGGDYDSGEEYNAVSVLSVDFEEREGEYFAYIPPLKNAKATDQVSGTLIPGGEISKISGIKIYFKSPLNILVGNLDHTVCVTSLTGDILQVGDVIEVHSDHVVVSNAPSLEHVGKFAFFIEKSYINGHSLRAPFIRVSFSDWSNERLAIFASRINVIESKNV